MSAAAWIEEVVRTAAARTHLPGAPITARVREDLATAVADAAGDPWCEAVHRAWRELLGHVDGDDPAPMLLDYARTCGIADAPLDPGPALEELLPPAALRAVRATIARAALECRLPAPLQLPLLALATMLRTASRLAPPVPPVEVTAEPNLLAHLLADAARLVVANAAVRLALRRVPGTAVVGFRAGRSAATLRWSQRRVAVDNGIAQDAFIVLEGDIEPLLRMASGSVVRDVTRLRVHR